MQVKSGFDESCPKAAPDLDQADRAKGGTGLIYLVKGNLPYEMIDGEGISYYITLSATTLGDWPGSSIAFHGMIRCFGLFVS